jgi:hypothetical protein
VNNRTYRIDVNHGRHRIPVCDYHLYRKLVISKYPYRITRLSYRYSLWRNSYRRNFVNQTRTHDVSWPAVLGVNWVWLGSFAKLWNPTVGFVTSVRLSASPSFCLSVCSSVRIPVVKRDITIFHKHIPRGKWRIALASRRVKQFSKVYVIIIIIIQWRYSPTGPWPTERPPPVSEASANFCG